MRTYLYPLLELNLFILIHLATIKMSFFTAGRARNFSRFAQQYHINRECFFRHFSQQLSSGACRSTITTMSLSGSWIFESNTATCSCDISSNSASCSSNALTKKFSPLRIIKFFRRSKIYNSLSMIAPISSADVRPGIDQSGVHHGPIRSPSQPNCR